jgi:hypothetical protein
MTLRTISQFKSKLQGGGARPNLFEVSIPSFPPALQSAWTNSVSEKFNFMCEATSMPASTVNPIDIPFRGRILKVAGDRTIDIWSVTVINDEDFDIRSAFEKWANLISKLDNASGATDPNAYMVNAFVKQLGRGAQQYATTNNSGNTSAVLRTYKLYDIWPSSVGAIDLSYADNNTIERFTVDFQMQWFEVGDTSSGGASNANLSGDVIQ